MKLILAVLVASMPLVANATDCTYYAEYAANIVQARDAGLDEATLQHAVLYNENSSEAHKLWVLNAIDTLYRHSPHETAGQAYDETISVCTP